MEEPPEEKESPQRNRLFAIISVVIGLLVGTFAGGYLVEVFVEEKQTAQPVRFPDASWSTRTVGDISLETPVELMERSGPASEMPEEIRGSILNMEIYQGEKEGAFYLVVSKIQYRDSVGISLERAVEVGMMHAAAAMGADEKPVFDAKPIQVDGREGRRASYRQHREGRMVRIDGLFVHERQQVWSLQVIYIGDEVEPDAARILNSVKIARRGI